MAKKQDECFDISELKQKHDTPEPVFCGVCTAQKWRAGKVVTEAEYVKAVDDFTGCATGRRTADA